MFVAFPAALPCESVHQASLGIRPDHSDGMFSVVVEVWKSELIWFRQYFSMISLIHDFIDCGLHCWFDVGCHSFYDVQYHNIISDFVETILHFVLKRLQTMPRMEVPCFWWELFLNFSTKSICFEDIASCVMGVRRTTWNTSQGCVPLGQVSANSALPRFQHRAHLRPDERIPTSCNPARPNFFHIMTS